MAAPIITSLTNSLATSIGDLAGGYTATLAGSGFSSGGLTAITVDGVSATNVSVTNDTTATCTIPTGVSNGLKDVAASGPGGASNTLTNGWRYWDPSAATFTGWWREDVTLASTKVSSWNDKSGNSRNLTQGTDASRPTWEATGGPNSTSTLVFDVAATTRLATTTTLGTFFTNANIWAYHLVKIASITTDLTDGLVYSNEAIWADTGQEAGLHLKKTGSLAKAYNFDGSNDVATQAITLDAWQLLTMRHLSGNVELRLGDDAYITTASGNTAATTGAMRIGVEGLSLAGITGRITEMIFSNADVGATVDGYALAYFATRYGLSL